MDEETTERSTHEDIVDGRWWEHSWAGIYAGLIRDFGYEPYDEYGRPQVLLFYTNPGHWSLAWQVTKDNVN